MNRNRFASNMACARRRGFSLVELLLYTSILGLMTLAVSVFLAALLEARAKSQLIVEVEQQGIALMRLMTQIARNSSHIVSPATSTSASSLSLAVASTTLSPTIFSVATGTLRITEGASAPLPLTNARVNVSSIQFSNLSRSGTPGVVRMRFTISGTATSSARQEFQYEREFIGTASLRHP